MQEIADRLVRLTDHAQVSRETVRRRLKEKKIKPWQKKMWCIPKLDADFVAQMEHILDLYAERPNADKPAINFESSPAKR